MLGIFGQIVSYVWGSAEPTKNSKTVLDLPDLYEKVRGRDKDSACVNTCYEDSLNSQKEENEIQDFHGKITSLNNSERYGLINREIYFDFKTVADNYDMVLNVGDDVAVCATRKSSNHAWCAKRVILMQEIWDDNKDEVVVPNDSHLSNTNSSSVWDTCNPLGESKIDASLEEYTIVAKVTKIGNGQGVLNNNISFSLKECITNFRPIVGDWVSACIDSSGSQDRVISLASLRELNIRSRITSVSYGGGVINSEIVFSNLSCCKGYYPVVGDLVDVRAVESSQERFEWRAVSVNPVHQLNPQPVVSKLSSPTCGNFLQQLLCNKEGIQINESLDFGTLLLGRKKYLTAFIRNEGNKECRLLKCRLQTSEKNCQFSIGVPSIFHHDEINFRKSPKEVDTLEDFSTSNGIILSPSSTACVTVTCEARNLGKSHQMLLFDFESFVIGRHLNVNVLDPVQNSLNPTSPYKRQNQKAKDMKNGASSWIVPGEKPPRARVKFSTTLPQYSVPSRLWDLLDDDELLVFAPYLAKDLDTTNYKNKFSTLLHLEEIQMMLDMKEFDMEEVCLNVKGDYLSLKVPGLAEGRPSLLIGDRALLSNPGDDDPQSLVFEGFIHEVFQDSILLKFNSTFHNKYDGESYNVTFQFNRTPLRKCHQAASAAVQLGSEVLFPSTLQLKKSLIDVLDLPTSKTCSDVRCNVMSPELHIFNKLSVTGKAHKSSSDCGSLKENVNVSNSFQSHCPEQTLHTLKKNENSYVSNRKINEKQISVCTSEKASKPKLIWFNDKLNERQKTAVKRILNGQCRPMPYVIFGPPGTGKTVTVVEAVLQIFKNITFSRILICTPSNSAADLVACRLVESGLLQKADIIRLNSFQRDIENIPEIIKPFCVNGGDLQLAAHHRIVVSTCVTAGSFHSLGLRTDHFTHVFVDEAGQATEPECMIPVVLAATRGGQVVLAGDPLQLGPVIRSPHAKEYGLQVSFLDRLMDRPLYHRDEKKFSDHGNYDPLLVTKLVNNYRSHPAIIEIFSTLFYHSELISYSQQEALCSWSLLPNSGFPLLFHGVKGEDFREGNSPSWFNPAEVVQVIKYLQSLYDYGLSPMDVGVVTPYRKQVEKIQLLISSFGLQSCKIGSVEEFQGQECLAIIISTVRSCDDYVNFDYIHNLGFLSNPKRFNVAVSRAQALLIVIGDPHLLCKDPCWESLLNYCLVNNSYVGCDLPPEYLEMKQEC